MEPHVIPKLFALFSQAQSALDRSEGGLGVGLALVRGLVGLHGGIVEARSDGPGRGSEFVVRLPSGLMAQPVVEAVTADRPPVAGAALKILVVDDNRDAADTCATLLELSGHQVQVAYAGEKALAVAGRFQPHVAILDIGLPDINGYELARRIRSAPWGRDIALVAMTGWGQDEDRRRALEAGFDRHLTKPLAADALEALVNELSAAVGPQRRA
jgi:CheY-like chemotaxis protein